MPQSRPGEGLHEVRAAQGDLAGELRAILRICRLQKQIGCSGIYQLHLLTTILNDCEPEDGTFNFKFLVFSGRVHWGWWCKDRWKEDQGDPSAPKEQGTKEQIRGGQI